MQVTRKDVALAAGVSTATVSNVLNNSDKVAPDTALIVKQKIKELNYSPNLVARSLSTKKTMQVGIVLEDISNPFFAQIARDFEAAADEKNYFVNICMGLNKLDDYFDNFISRGIDGVFVTALPHKFDTSKLYNLVNHGIKIVASGNIEVDIRQISSIENDFEKGMNLIVEYLFQLGHRKIAYLSGLGRKLSNDLRCISYLRALEKVGIESNEKLLVDGKFPYTTTIADGYDYAKQLMASGEEFSAVICGNDMMALGAMRAFRENGYSIPEDISVAGIDGIQLGEYCNPSLTSVAVDRELGKKAFQLLYGNMLNGTVGYYKNDVKLITRESTSKVNK